MRRFQSMDILRNFVPGIRSPFRAPGIKYTEDRVKGRLMRAVIQRVKQASVSVEGAVVGSCGRGYLVLLGVGAGDTRKEAERLWSKVLNLRICADDEGKTNRSIGEVSGELLVVSQFTLYADCRRGRRPSFTGAADPETAQRLYEEFVSLARQDIARVETGVFGADMDVSLVNDGPFTIVLDTDEMAG